MPGEVTLPKETLLNWNHLGGRRCSQLLEIVISNADPIKIELQKTQLSHATRKGRAINIEGQEYQLQNPEELKELLSKRQLEKKQRAGNQ